MSKNHFYEKKGPFPLIEIIKGINYNGNFSDKNNLKIHGIESLYNAKENDITFLNSAKYKEESIKSKATACITSNNLEKYLPVNCTKIKYPNSRVLVKHCGSIKTH